MFQNLEKIGYEKYLEKYPFNEFLNIKTIDYKKNPTQYCSMPINDNPYFDLV